MLAAPDVIPRAPKLGREEGGIGLTVAQVGEKLTRAVGVCALDCSRAAARTCEEGKVNPASFEAVPKMALVSLRHLWCLALAVVFILHLDGDHASAFRELVLCNDGE